MKAKLELDVGLVSQSQRLHNTPRNATEYDKMISGMLYNSTDPDLVMARHRARILQYQYNNFYPVELSAETHAEARLLLLRQMLGQVGDETYIESPFLVDYGCNISLGARFYGNYNLVILDCSLVVIGDRVMCGPNVSIYAATHETDVTSRRNNIEYAREVNIGDDVWIGGGSTILPGVTIGEGSTIGAGSLVTKDVPPWSVVHGSTYFPWMSPLRRLIEDKNTDLCF